MTGAGTKSLVVPALSSSFKWTPKEVAGRADSTIYILCKRKLKNEVQFYSCYISLTVLHSKRVDFYHCMVFAVFCG